jgi:GntR family transcriptional regulator, regulator for abcA and norABC
MNKQGQRKYLFEEIFESILQRIERSDWKAGEKLPSIRELSLELNVHRLTVFKAYQMLKQQGKVLVKDKSGYYVKGNSDSIDTDMSFQANKKRYNLSDIHQQSVEYQFSKALIDPNLLPNHFLSDYVKKVFDLYPKVLSTYSTVQGDIELREVLADYFTKRYKTYLSHEDILITSGSQQAIHLISQLFLSPRDTVLIERPTYSAAIDIFKSQQAQMLTVDIHPDGYDLEQVEMLMKTYKPRLFYVNPTFHNPTGYTVPTAQRKKLVELAEEYHCFIVEDDAYHDIYFEQAPPPPLYTFDTAGVVLYVRSFCKYVSPGLRVAAVVFPPNLKEGLFTAKALADNGSPLLNQKIFLHYFSSPRLQQHLEKLRIALQIRKEIMEEELKQTNWSWVSPNGGLNLWIQLPTDLPTDQLLPKGIEHSVSFVPGLIFDPLQEQFSSSLRLSYSYANEVQLRAGIRRLIDLVNTYT